MKKFIISSIILFFIACFCVSAQAAGADPFGIDVYENGMTRQEYYNQSIAQYADFDYSDPQTTTDEELFGVWDEEAGHWTTEPLFDYEGMDGLAQIETEAKRAQGDYALCKELTLEYYKKKFSGFNFSRTTSHVRNYVMLTAEMRFENWTTRPALGPLPMSKLLVSKQAGWISGTVFDAVTNIAAASDKRVTLHLYALKKDGYTAIFDSKEGVNVPYIEATVNGVARKFYAVADTYVSAGDNKNTNYGAEEKLLAEESYSSIGELSTVNSYTRRSVLKFDFSSLNDTDRVTAAILYVYGHMEKSDDPVKSGIEKDSKIVFVMNDTSGNSWNEEKLAWDYISGSSWVCLNYDATAGYVNKSIQVHFPGVTQYRSSIMGMSHDLSYFANYYGGTGDETFGYHLIRETMHKIRELNCEFTSTEQPTLNLIRVQSLIKVMNECKDSVHMTPEIFVAFLKNCYEHAEAIVGSERFKDVRGQIWTPDVKTSNIGALQTAALLEVAAVFEEFKAVDEPLNEQWRTDGSYNGGWKAVAENRFQHCMESSFLPDGSLTDAPINYIWTNVNNYLTPLVNYTENYNFDVTSVLGGAVKENLLKTAEHVSRIISPLLGGWQEGDNSSYIAKQNTPIRRICNLWPQDVSELAKYIGSNRTTGSAPTDFTSYVSEDAHKAVLRSNWDEDAVAIGIQSNSFLYHTHSDDLSMTMFAYGNFLLADPTRYNYNTTEPISIWQQSREAHNSIVVDGNNAKKTGGSMHSENRELNSIYDFVHLDSQGYENQLIQRYVCFVRPGYFIVTDHVTSSDSNTHNYRQNWHFQPDANISINELSQTVTNYPTKANLTVSAVSSDNELSKEMCTGYYSQTANTSLMEEYNYVSYNKDVAGNTSFQTLLYPSKPGETLDIQTEVLPSSIDRPEARAMRAIIKNTNNKETITDYYLLLDETKKAEVTYGDFKTDATMALTEYINDSSSAIILRKGTYIENTSSGRRILSLKHYAEDIGISFDATQMNIETSKKDTNIDGLTVYIGNKNISAVTYNGKNSAFTKNGSYIYLGSSPAYTLPTEDEPKGNGDKVTADDSTYVPKGAGSAGSIGNAGGIAADGSVNAGTNDNGGESISTDKPSDAFKNELAGHWGGDEIAFMIDNSFVNGNGVSLALDDSITRAEFIAVIVRALALETSPYEGIFSDVGEDMLFAPVLESAYRHGILDGYDGTAVPNTNITREQMAKILVRAYETKHDVIYAETAAEYIDTDEISEWAKEYVCICLNIGLMNGYEDESFRPLKNTTRGEAFVTIYRLLQQ